MTSNSLRNLAERLAAGSLGIEDFLAAASASTVADLGDAQVDLDRTRRCGFPEVVYGEGKTTEQLQKIFATLIASGVDVLATRVDSAKADVLRERFPAGRYNATARIFRIPQAAPTTIPSKSVGGRVVIVTAGTSDLPVAEEAYETALWMGADVRLIQDVGVAGPQRLIARLPEIRGADAVVVVAGMEAALPSVVGGHVDCPVIGVPTSIGYGASLGGMTALFGMLTSCAANVTVVNIDAGFKGGYLAGLIASRSRRD
ncbi:MAG: nickel pincer cofactor biosynthesis protein LarB [Planctomycetia bacterium]|nr:nickel pincer cofactor biosynthesis protein LarB [Planctomycetia bacterium]